MITFSEKMHPKMETVKKGSYDRIWWIKKAVAATIEALFFSKSRLLVKNTSLKRNSWKKGATNIIGEVNKFKKDHI
jgi:hypothetical protein